jgi:sorbitol/mannitol transport system substrate-binding protein
MEGTLKFYVDLMKEAGPPGASSNGFNENLALFQTGQVRHVDRRHRCCVLRHQPEGLDRGRQGRLALWPGQGPRQPRQLAVGLEPRHSGGLQEGGSRREVRLLGDEQGLHQLVASKEGWAERSSGHAHLALCERGLSEGSSFREDDARCINAADPTKPTVKPVPYVGVQFVAIPEFQGIGTPSASSSPQLLPASDGRPGAAAAPSS